jgi:hypothetical protein
MLGASRERRYQLGIRRGLSRTYESSSEERGNRLVRPRSFED